MSACPSICVPSHPISASNSRPSVEELLPSVRRLYGDAVTESVDRAPVLIRLRREDK
jgi:hypothetical protein